MLPRFHNLVPLLGHGPVNDYLIPSPTPIWVHFSTISTSRSPEAHLNRDINGDTVKNGSQGKVCLGLDDRSGVAHFSEPPSSPGGSAGETLCH